jgi:hypothetical protein
MKLASAHVKGEIIVVATISSWENLKPRPIT